MTIGYDLKNPLGAILSYTEIFELKGGEDPEKETDNKKY